MELRIHEEAAGVVSIASEIERAERELASANLDGSIARLERLYADNALIGHTTGTIDSKASWLERLRSEFHYVAFATSDLTIRSYGVTAVCIGTCHYAVAPNGGDTVSRSTTRFTRVYMRQGTDWRIVAHNQGLMRTAPTG